MKDNSSKGKGHDLVFPHIYGAIQKELYETKEMNAQTSGSTMITLLLERGGLLTCANVGDSRAILARQSRFGFS